ncbi:type II toxin-antitoxin system RelE/ParE family toxin [Guyparkeria sp.]|uniref:type II toxin-antitoxin system RelE/ParE family toxin n=1 Tax=Guyparkeria sp. TaxID=2035736 RepID=UPI00397109B4
MPYRLSRKAEEDIIGIVVSGTLDFGPAQAERYHKELERTFRFLDDNPLAARLREEISPPVRVDPVDSQLIVYTQEPDGHIFIVRVRHSHEDWQSHTGR